MKISSAHVPKKDIEKVGANFAHEFRKAILNKTPAILVFDGKDMFDFATPPHIGKDVISN